MIADPNIKTSSARFVQERVRIFRDPEIALLSHSNPDELNIICNIECKQYQYLN